MNGNVIYKFFDTSNGLGGSPLRYTSGSLEV